MIGDVAIILQVIKSKKTADMGKQEFTEVPTDSGHQQNQSCKKPPCWWWIVIGMAVLLIAILILLAVFLGNTGKYHELTSTEHFN